MKSLAELTALRDKLQGNVSLREQAETKRIVVGMATCGIAAGARPVLNAFVEGVDKEAAVAFPIIGGGDVSGALVMLLNENGSCPTQTETKLAQIAANFLGKQMEE